jgi:hypothetical protein
MTDLYDVVVYHGDRKITDTVTGSRRRAVARRDEIHRGEAIAVVLDRRGKVVDDDTSLEAVGSLVST